LIDSLLRRLQAAFDGTCTICTNGQSELIARGFPTPEGNVVPNGSGSSFYVDDVPRGTAGCLKACESRFRGGAILVAGASVWLEDDLTWMLEQHLAQGNALTVFCTRHELGGANGSGQPLTPVGVYCCDPKVLDYVPAQGYYDLKEQLVPRLREAGLRVGAVVVPGHTREVSSWSTYMQVVVRSLSGSKPLIGYRCVAPGVWCGDEVEVAPRARIVGPALLGHGCKIENGATLIGPTILGDRCRVTGNSWVIRVVAPPRTVFPAGTSVTDRLISATGAEHETAGASNDETALTRPKQSRHTVSGLTNGSAHGGGSLAKVLVPACLLSTVFVWAFSDTFAQLWNVWQTNQDYSVGQLVPFAALYMAWTQRSELAKLHMSPSLAGALVFMAGVAINATGGYFLYSSLGNLGMVVCANGLVMGFIGWKGYKRVWYPMAFLLLMLPLPGQIHDAVMLPLQGLCARMGATVLEMAGVPAERYGHVLEVAGHKTAVAEACNGMRMTFAFMVVTGVVAYLIRRPLWQKITVFVSSIPIALACNVARIVVMAYLYGMGQGLLVEGWLHDGAGLLMMPLALSLALLELWVLSNLVVPSTLTTAPGYDSSRRLSAASGR